MNYVKWAVATRGNDNFTAGALQSSTGIGILAMEGPWDIAVISTPEGLAFRRRADAYSCSLVRARSHFMHTPPH